MATIWKVTDDDDVWAYRFNIVRMNRRGGQASQQFLPQNVLHLAKLVQLLASALADDG